jgi:hypothetical protein
MLRDVATGQIKPLEVYLIMADLWVDSPEEMAACIVSMHGGVWHRAGAAHWGRVHGGRQLAAAGGLRRMTVHGSVDRWMCLALESCHGVLLQLVVVTVRARQA